MMFCKQHRTIGVADQEDKKKPRSEQKIVLRETTTMQRVSETRQKKMLWCRKQRLLNSQPTNCGNNNGAKAL